MIYEEEAFIMSYLSLTTWSLHRNLGPLHWTRWDEQKGEQYLDIQDQPETTSLLELPAKLASMGYSALEIGHFHIRDTSDTYLQKLRNAFKTAGIPFYTLLADYGDISSSDEARRSADIEWVKIWIDIASKAGAERVRVIAGDADASDSAALQRSADALRILCDYAALRNVRVITENFRPLSYTADNCLSLLEVCGDRLGLTSDFGNYKGDDKFEELAKTVPHSESIHAKAITSTDGYPDAAEFKQCMDVVKKSGYQGPITIVYDGPNNMWDGIERVRVLVAPYLSE
jgi:sugar phosphate isomerase/epimerase